MYMLPTAQEFEHMSMEEQQQLLSDQGTFLITRTRDEHSIDLYWLNEFFAEVWFVNMGEAEDSNHESFDFCILTDITVIKNEEDINRYIDLYSRARY